MVLKEAVSVSEDVMQDIQTLYSLQEVRTCFIKEIDCVSCFINSLSDIQSTLIISNSKGLSETL